MKIAGVGDLGAVGEQVPVPGQAAEARGAQQRGVFGTNEHIERIEDVAGVAEWLKAY